MSEREEGKAPAHRLVDKAGDVTRDQPWIFRTYAGHSSPKASNELYRANLGKGQTGLSIAFDLATQCGYDSDDPIALPDATVSSPGPSQDACSKSYSVSFAWSITVRCPSDCCSGSAFAGM